MEKVIKYIEENRPRFIKDLCAYLRFASVSAQPTHKKDILACASWLREYCESIGLEAKLCKTKGNPVLFARTPRSKKPGKPVFLIYGHYDVQPPEPFDLWDSHPFEPKIKNGAIYARGASDNKGQHFAHLMALEAFLKTGTELPCDVMLLIEGEEEGGNGENLTQFLKENREKLQCDGVIISDGGMPGKGLPALTYSLRGITSLIATVHGPSRDLHSGYYGGAVDNPALVLCQMLASLRDKNGRVTIPGFYDDVEPLSRFERKQLAKLPFEEDGFKKFLGIPGIFGEKNFLPNEQRTARPTFEINGLTSGYQGEGTKTIIPSWARANLTFRLVSKQKPESIQKLIIEHLRKICPPSVRLAIEPGHGGEPYFISPTGKKVQCALEALQRAFGVEPLLTREGGSIPIISELEKNVSRDILLLGLALPDDNPHAPNEKFDLDCLFRGAKMSTVLFEELGKHSR